MLPSIIGNENNKVNEYLKKRREEVRLLSVGDWAILIVLEIISFICILIGIFGNFSSITGNLVCVGCGLSLTVVDFLYVFKFKLPAYRKLLSGKITKHGMIFYLSKATKDMSLQLFEEWTESCLKHWKKTLGYDMEEMLKILPGLQVRMYDRRFMSFIREDENGEEKEIKYSGAYYFRSSKKGFIKLCTIQKNKELKKRISQQVWIKNLYRHELSHHFLTKIGKISAKNLGEEQHKIFKETKLFPYY